ncbi:hypothetical protein LSH36_58g06034 [Paralvinella palmiformis]|uniref:Uncharacterized protein n=1 Tax=Paralvinella palmiformis TaxID=53620 RepID=A0AAD9K4V8_9ANNE|nr:hypothetical protein LSH36_58g06034 [Paralvinella palmiformis]
MTGKKYSTTLKELTPGISSNPDIDIHHDNIELSVPEHTANYYNRRTNVLPPEGFGNGDVWVKAKVIPIPQLDRLLPPNQNLF